VLILSDIAPDTPIGWLKNGIFSDFGNKAGRQSKTKQASRGLSAIAELLVYAVVITV